MRLLNLASNFVLDLNSNSLALLDLDSNSLLDSIGFGFKLFVRFGFKLLTYIYNLYDCVFCVKKYSVRERKGGGRVRE